MTGTYTWTVAYSGDGNNNAASDQGGAAEQVTVSAASPTLTTTPDPTTVTLSATAPPILTDTATLAAAFARPATITFTAVPPGGDAGGHGDGRRSTATAPTRRRPASPCRPAARPTGTYQWDAAYSGDANNSTASDINATNEQVTVSPASPTLMTTPNPTTVTLGATAPPIADRLGARWRAAITRPAPSPSR